MVRYVLLIKQGSKLFNNAWIWHKHVEHIVLSILTGHLHFFDKQTNRYEFYKFWYFSELEIGCRKLFVPKSTWPKATDQGARGHVGWPGWPGRLGQRPAWPAPRRRQRPAMGGARANSEARGGVQPDRRLTGDPPVGSAWPEDGRRRWIWRRQTSVSGEETATPAAIGGEGLQFFRLGGRGRRGAPSQHVGETGGGTEWRRYASGSDYCEFHVRELETNERRRAAREGRRSGRLGFFVGGGWVLVDVWGRQRSVACISAWATTGMLPPSCFLNEGWRWPCGVGPGLVGLYQEGEGKEEELGCRPNLV
jgi:hypothetical protein